MNEKVSVIIAFYNKIELLKLVLAALSRQTYSNFEVIVADDGSKKEIVTELNSIQNNYSFPIIHVWHDDNGWQKNKILNKSVLASSSDYLIFIDGDCIPHRQFVQEHVENRKPERVIAGRRVLLTEKISKTLNVNMVLHGNLSLKVFFPLLYETIFKGRVTKMENMIRIRNKTIRKFFVKEKIRTFWGCNYSIWKSDLLKVNGFDERYVNPGTGEDTDLDDRLRRIGVLPISKKHMLTQFHIYHVHFNTNIKENILLRTENNLNEITDTPYGINKTDSGKM
jgi:glycosyltransferase involved in cell wall biosynthesis